MDNVPAEFQHACELVQRAPDYSATILTLPPAAISRRITPNLSVFWEPTIFKAGAGIQKTVNTVNIGTKVAYDVQSTGMAHITALFPE